MGQLTVILILFALQIITFLYFRMMIRKELSRENRIESVRREIEQLIIELDRTADRNVEIVEDRIRTLKASIIKGEKIIHLIESEWDKRDRPNPLYTDLKPLQREEPRLPSNEIIGITPDEPLVLDIEVLDNKERAIELYKQGMDTLLIASATGLPRGEVELIISLKGEG